MIFFVRIVFDIGVEHGSFYGIRNTDIIGITVVRNDIATLGCCPVFQE